MSRDGYGYLYIVLGRENVESSNAIIIGMILIFHHLAVALFDLRSTISMFLFIVHYS